MKKIFVMALVALAVGFVSNGYAQESQDNAEVIELMFTEPSGVNNGDLYPDTVEDVLENVLEEKSRLSEDATDASEELQSSNWEGFRIRPEVVSLWSEVCKAEYVLSEYDDGPVDINVLSIIDEDEIVEDSNEFESVEPCGYVSSSDCDTYDRPCMVIGGCLQNIGKQLSIFCNNVATCLTRPLIRPWFVRVDEQCDCPECDSVEQIETLECSKVEKSDILILSDLEELND